MAMAPGNDNIDSLRQVRREIANAISTLKLKIGQAARGKTGTLQIALEHLNMALGEIDARIEESSKPREQ